MESRSVFSFGWQYIFHGVKLNHLVQCHSKYACLLDKCLLQSLLQNCSLSLLNPPQTDLHDTVTFYMFCLLDIVCRAFNIPSVRDCLNAVNCWEHFILFTNSDRKANADTVYSSPFFILTEMIVSSTDTSSA